MDGSPSLFPHPSELTIRQSRSACFHGLISPIPAVVVVRAGIKGVVAKAASFDVPEGTAVLIPGGSPLTIENRPPSRLPYRAEALPLSWEGIARAYARAGVERPSVDRLGPVSVTPEFEEAFGAAAQALAHPDRYPQHLRDHRQAEVVLWLAELGALFGPEPERLMAHRVRDIALEDLARPWSAAELAARLAMSEPTLRRRLAREGETLTDILVDARMTQALALLQTTDRGVEAVASAVGYASPSRFAARFRARFGLPPRDIRRQKGAD